MGVYKSTDYGDSWFPINNGLNAAEVLDLHIDNEGTFYTASWRAGLAKSTDKGETWITVNGNNKLQNIFSYRMSKW